MHEPAPEDDAEQPPIPRGSLEDSARLFAALSEELRAMAHRIAGREAGHTMQPTALVNELFVKFCGGKVRNWNDESHFMRSAARAMRSILLDHKKAKRTQKRGGAAEPVPLDSILHQLESKCGGDLVAVHEALDQLAKEDPVVAELVTLRFFGGRTLAEAARLLGICERTCDEHWRFAKAWLNPRLES